MEINFIQNIAQAVLSEAGVLSAVLFVWGVFLTLDNLSLRKSNSKLHDRLYNLSMEQIGVNKDTNNLLDTIIKSIMKG